MGCSASEVAISTLPPTLVPLDSVQSPPKEETHSKTNRFLENCLIVWLTSSTSSKYTVEREELRTRVYGLKIFNNIDGCIAFLSNIQDEKVFLIISNFDQSIERLQYLNQIEKIYIFTSNSHESSHFKYPKVNYDLVENLDELNDKLENDMKSCVANLIPITVAPIRSETIKSIVDLSRYEASFLFCQILREVAYRLKFDSHSKDVFIDYCRAHYSHKSLDLVEQMAHNYRPHQALFYLSTYNFVSQILQRVLRTREIDLIYKLGFFIKQIHIQLNRLYEENLTLMKNISTVYRGKTVSHDEFDSLLKDKTGEFLSFSSYLIASITKQTATNFIYDRLKLHPDTIGILFEIEIDLIKFNEKTPFALMKDADFDCDAICFNLYPVFSIQSIESIRNDSITYWSVKLTIVDHDDSNLNHYLTITRLEEVHANPLSYIGVMLLEIGEYQRAERILLGLIQDQSVLSQPRRLLRVHNGLGAVYTHKKDYTKALYHYQQALQTGLIYLQVDHQDLAPLYKSIGDSYFYLNYYSDAIMNYEKSIEIGNNGTMQMSSEFLSEINLQLQNARQSTASLK